MTCFVICNKQFPREIFSYDLKIICVTQTRTWLVFLKNLKCINLVTRSHKSVIANFVRVIYRFLATRYDRVGRYPSMSIYNELHTCICYKFCLYVVYKKCERDTLPHVTCTNCAHFFT